jgi:hypothetical protein
MLGKHPVNLEVDSGSCFSVSFKRTTNVELVEERFFDILKVVGTKMNIHLKGSENFFEWHQKLQKLLLRLKCTGVLTNEGSGLVEYEL